MAESITGWQRGEAVHLMAEQVLNNNKRLEKRRMGNPSGKICACHHPLILNSMSIIRNRC